MALSDPPHGRLSGTPRWRLVDRVLAAYGVVVGVYCSTRLGQPGTGWVMAAHLALPGLAWLVAHARPSRTVDVLRAIYPVVLLIALYSAIDVLNGFGAAPTFDRQIQAIEQAIFGMQPSRDWWRADPSQFWSTVLHAAYLSYYFIVAVPVFVLLGTGRRAALDRYLDGLLATYLVCYVFYLFLPVAGPYYAFTRPTGPFVDNIPAHLVYAVLRGGSSFGAAFPSSHVAATVAATIGGWRASRRLGVILAVPTAFLTVAVVYCQMHYAVDAISGVVLGVVVAGIAGGTSEK
ncbi:MAG: phosphatase PAP2 family protein [Gemmatimonadales bacterium]